MKVEGGRFALSVAEVMKRRSYRFRLRIESSPDLIEHIEYAHWLARFDCTLFPIVKVVRKVR